MLIFLLLLVIALLAFGFATTVHWLIWLAIIAAIVFVIFWAAGRGSASGSRRWW